LIDSKKNKLSINTDIEEPTETTTMAHTVKSGVLTLQDADLEKIGNILESHFSTQLKGSVSSIVDGVVKGLSEKISQLEAENAELKGRIRSLEQSADAAEQYSRHNCLRISGAPESKANSTDDTDSYVLKMAKALNTTLTINEIDR